MGMSRLPSNRAGARHAQPARSSPSPAGCPFHMYPSRNYRIGAKVKARTFVVRCNTPVLGFPQPSHTSIQKISECPPLPGQPPRARLHCSVSQGPRAETISNKRPPTHAREGCPLLPAPHGKQCHHCCWAIATVQPVMPRSPWQPCPAGRLLLPHLALRIPPSRASPASLPG